MPLQRTFSSNSICLFTPREGGLAFHRLIHLDFSQEFCFWYYTLGCLNFLIGSLHIIITWLIEEILALHSSSTCPLFFLSQMLTYFENDYSLTIFHQDLVPSFAKISVFLSATMEVLTRRGENTVIKGNVDHCWLNIKIILAVSLLHINSCFLFQ